MPDRDSPAYPILILDDFNADGGQSRPLAVVCGSDSTALVCLELADCMGGSSEERGRSPRHAHPWSQTSLHLGSGHHPAPLLLWPSLERLPCPDANPCPPPSRTPALTFTGEAVGGDPWKSFAAHVAEGGAGVGAGVPVVHAREMLHVELCGLETQPCPISAWHSQPAFSPGLLSPPSPTPVLLVGLCQGQQLFSGNQRHTEGNTLHTEIRIHSAPCPHHLMDLPLLDRLQGCDPVLHLLPVLRT